MLLCLALMICNLSSTEIFQERSEISFISIGDLRIVVQRSMNQRRSSRRSARPSPCWHPSHSETLQYLVAHLKRYVVCSDANQAGRTCRVLRLQTNLPRSVNLMIRVLNWYLWGFGLWRLVLRRRPELCLKLYSYILFLLLFIDASNSGNGATRLWT